MKRNLVLTGMMGVGKSTIANALSKKLNLELVDIDKIIQKKELSSIEKIFSNRGEGYFRKIEEKITLLELKKKNCVMALGGGAFINQNIRNLILKTCVSFWLDLSVEEISRRVIRSKKRPLLNEGDLRENIKKIYKEREKIYSLANYKVNCNNLERKETINKIINLYDVK